jgi:hypothetical protein
MTGIDIISVSIMGIIVAFDMGGLMSTLPGLSGSFGLFWTWESFARTIGNAFNPGSPGGLFSALRATRL